MSPGYGLVSQRLGAARRVGIGPPRQGHDMADRMTLGETASTMAEAGLDAFIRHGDDVPVACHAALISSLSRLRGSDDPVVTFAGLPGACVPEFADGCEVELSDR